MATELRKTGISVVGDMPWGTHFCSFYETKQDLLDILIPYFKTGLENHEFCLWIVSNSELLTMQEANNALQAVLPDLHRYRAEKSIEVIGHDWFLNGGSFDFRRVANQFKEKVDEALARGYVGMRVNASPAWLETSNGKELNKFEAEVDQLYPHERIIASCTYPIGSSRADFLLDVTRNHRFAIARRHGIWDIVETPELTQAKAEIERLNVELEQRVIERTKKLEETTDRLRAEIEERKGAEEALRQSEERFVAFMDNLPGYAWMKDLQGRYVYVNEMVRGLPGYRSLGKTDAQIWPADLAAEYRANDQQVIAAKKPLQTLEHYQQEGKQRYMAGSKFPIFDKTGAVALVGGAGVDITERIEAEAALRESEAKLKQAQQLANIGYWERDLIADRITWSKETGRILGLESFRGVPNQAQLREFIHPDDRQHHQQVLDEALQGSRLFDVEFRFVRPDGNTRFVHVRDEIVRDESGKPILMFGAVQDVTERRRAEEAVRRSQEHLRLVIDTIPTMAWSLRPDGTLDFANQRWLDYAGLSFEEAVKNPTSAIHPEDIPRVMERWLADLAAGKSSEDEMRLRRADGEYRWFLVRAEPLRDDRGNITEWYGSSVDIEDRKRAELASRVLIDAIPDQIWSGPPDGTNDYVNARWRSETGLGSEEMRGDGWQTLLHPDDRVRVLKAWQYSVQTGTPYEQEERHRTADGTYRWYLNRGLPLRDNEGHIIRWYGTNTDITERKRTEETLRISEENFRRVFYTNPAPGVIVSVRSRQWLNVNGAFVRTFGYPAEEAVGKTGTSLGIWSDTHEQEELWQRFQQDKNAINGYETRFITKSGAVIDVLLYVQAIELSGEECFLASVIDITERKQAEEAVRRSEEHLRLVIDTIPTMAWSVRPDGVVDFLNQRWLDYAGLSLERCVEDPTGPIHPDDIPRIIEKWRTQMAIGEGYEDEMRVRRADGEYRWFLIRTEPLRDARGNVVKWYGSSIDIEDRKQAEEKLKHSKVQLAQAQRLAHIGSWDWDLRTNAVHWSDELYHIFGLQPGTISVAGEVDRFIHPDDLDLGWDTVKRAVASKEPYDYYHRILRPDGTERIARSRGSIMSDERGEPIKVFGATQDVTELKRAEEKLKATTEQLRALSASVQSAREEESKRIAREIHDELGGALTSSKWDLEEMREIVSEPMDSSQVAALQTKIDGMITLSGTTLDTVKRLASELRPMALELGLAEAIEWQALQFESRTGIAVKLGRPLNKINLSNEQSTAIFRILQEALTNILRHAKATKVSIVAREKSGQFLMSIKDNGRGISESEKSGPQSLGMLGMLERAHLVGGEVKIESTEGKGTEVAVRIPLSTS